MLLSNAPWGMNTSWPMLVGVSALFGFISASAIIFGLKFTANWPTFVSSCWRSDDGPTFLPKLTKFIGNVQILAQRPNSFAPNWSRAIFAMMSSKGYAHSLTFATLNVVVAISKAIQLVPGCRSWAGNHHGINPIMHRSFSSLYLSKLVHHVMVGSASLRRRRSSSQQGTELARLKPV